MTQTGRYKCVKYVQLSDGQIFPIVLCDDNGAFIHILTFDCGVLTITNTDLDGNPYVPVGTVEDCSTASAPDDVEQQIFCDDNAGVLTPYMVTYEYDSTGAIVSSTITEIDGMTPYVVTGTTVVCAGEEGGTQLVTLCDDDTPFLRRFHYNNVGTVLSVVDTTLDGTTGYVVAGTVGLCILDSAEVNSDRLIPNPAGTDQVLIVDDTVGGTMFTDAGKLVGGGTGALHVDTTMVRVRFEAGRMRGTFDGTTPTIGVIPPGIGEPLVNNDRGTWVPEAILQGMFIAQTTFDGYIHVSEWKDA